MIRPQSIGYPMIRPHIRGHPYDSSKQSPSEVMTKWEYKIARAESLDDLEEEVNRLGLDGWEAIGAGNAGMGGGWHGHKFVVMKRPL